MAWLLNATKRLPALLRTVLLYTGLFPPYLCRFCDGAIGCRWCGRLPSVAIGCHWLPLVAIGCRWCGWLLLVRHRRSAAGMPWACEEADHTDRFAAMANGDGNTSPGSNRDTTTRGRNDGAPVTTADFDEALESWLEWQQAPWGRLRYSMAAAHLGRHIASTGLRIADVGGGNGLDGIRLAQHGHCVTVVDESSAMLAEAERVSRNLGLDSCFDTLQVGFGALAASFAPGTFDVVMAHNVLQFVDDLPGALAELRQIAQPGAVVSIICPNRDSETLRLAIREHDLAGALGAIGATSMANGLFRTHTHALCADDVTGALELAGFADVHRYGIRCVSDYIMDDSIKNTPSGYAALEQLELAMSDQPQFVAIARMFHLIATVQ
jgi:S-adenosylmethionine-dependent methyltransferase